MKKNEIFTNYLWSIWTLCIITTFISCSSNPEEIIGIESKPIAAEASFSIILKAYSEDEDITAKGDINNTTLYIFDENNDFYKQITVDGTHLLQAKPINIECPHSDRITVIAWSGISSNSEIINPMSQTNIISDLQLNLKQNNGIVSNFPNDLFHGQITLQRNSTKSASQVLKISRKVASITLTTKGIIKIYDSKEGSFFYKVKKSKSTFDYNGDLSGKDVEYIIPAFLNENGTLVAGSIPILPTSDISIELYKDNKMIISSENLQNSKKLSVKAGEQLCFSFDLSQKKCNTAVSSWGVSVNYTLVD